MASGAMYDLENNPKYGMSKFDSWFPIGWMPRGITPTDVDMMLHNAEGNKFLLFEFKPHGDTGSGGQNWMLQEFSKLPGCEAIIVQDPGSMIRNPETGSYTKDTPLTVLIWQNGNPRHSTGPNHHDIRTVGDLVNAICDWYGVPHTY